jgi:hypothetical protein
MTGVEARAKRSHAGLKGWVHLLSMTELPASSTSARAWLSRGPGCEAATELISSVTLLEESDACAAEEILAMGALVVGEFFALLDGLVKVQAMSKSVQLRHRAGFSESVSHFMRRLWQKSPLNQSHQRTGATECRTERQG